MKIKSVFISLSLLFGAVLSGANSAEAASFTSNVTKTNAKSNVILNSITQNGKTFDNFSYVNKAVIKYNTPKNTTNSNSGAASTDKGDNANSPLATAEDPTGNAIAAFLGNNNLNNIIDTEDDGSFIIDVFFDSKIFKDNSGLDNLFFWERGQNSTLGIQALDMSGNIIGNFKQLTETKKPTNYAGFQIDTKEIGGSQDVGSWGISLQDLGVTELSGLRLTSKASYSGPDFKVIARTSVPEPTTILGLGAVAGLALLRRRQLKQNSI
ncbi:exosortase-dependent surface protein XDP2 [Anabaena cylindrica UHCC 0172]|uniref:exosortase-dependent surface protein XDP2 n=1 Tax=Anabaena cylindrica TaxID=1165 RepID=UPI002B2217CC|nr:exosortase-dependent surface protein XDP2 [Anabaena cylindrica]MEA5550554.1 exosortase-dependent surface protein XDP2 [Anabaena cylindrica UHCC 0172]